MDSAVSAEKKTLGVLGEKGLTQIAERDVVDTRTHAFRPPPATMMGVYRGSCQGAPYYSDPARDEGGKTDDESKTD